MLHPINLFYVPDILNNPRLSEQESLHCVKVLRMREGNTLDITDGKGSIYQCLLLEASPKRCSVSVINRTTSPAAKNFKLHVAFAPTKQIDRNAWFIEKAVEIGIDRISPIYTANSERKEIKKEKLQNIAIAAMKQSLQAFLPIIDEMARFKEIITLPFEGRKFIAHCRDMPKLVLSRTYRQGEDAMILIGPEGDFTKEEVETAVDHGFEPVSLGLTRLRTETASLVAVHTLHVINATVP